MLEKHKVPTKYITLTRDIYDNVGTSARAGDSETYTFPVTGGDRGPTEALAPPMHRTTRIILYIPMKQIRF
jgi:hypothetical protein